MCLFGVLRLLLCLGGFCLAGEEHPPKEPQPEEKVPPPPPYVFNLGGLSAEQIEALKKVPGVLETTDSGTRLKVVGSLSTINPGNRGKNGSTERSASMTFWRSKINWARLDGPMEEGQILARAL